MHKRLAALAAVGFLASSIVASPQNTDPAADNFKIIVGKQDPEYLFIRPLTNSSAIVDGTQVTCHPKQMCIRIDKTWLGVGFPMSLFIDFFGSNDLNPPNFYPLINEDEKLRVAVAQAGQSPALTSLQFARTTTALLNQPFQILQQCTLLEQKMTTVIEGKTYWQACTPLKIEMIQGCVQSSLSQNNTFIDFTTVLMTNVVPKVPGEGDMSNFRIPIQCSYPLQYVQDLFMGLVNDNPTDDPNLPNDSGEVVFDPPGGGSSPDCSSDAALKNNPACDPANKPPHHSTDPNNPGYYKPNLGAVRKITVVNPRQQSVGKFPVYMFLYHTERYETFYTQPPILKQTNRLYVETGLLNPMEKATLTTRECWATPTANRTANKFMLIENYCPTQNAIDKINLEGIFQNGQDVKNRFNSKVFQISPSNRVYLFCKIKICFNLNGENCAAYSKEQKCAGRKRRSAGGYEFMPTEDDISMQGEQDSGGSWETIQLGPFNSADWSENGHPIVIIGQEDLQDLVREAVDESVEDSLIRATIDAGQDSGFPQWLFILLGVGCVVVALLLILFAYNMLQSKRYAM